MKKTLAFLLLLTACKLYADKKESDAKLQAQEVLLAMMMSNAAWWRTRAIEYRQMALTQFETGGQGALPDKVLVYEN